MSHYKTGAIREIPDYRDRQYYSPYKPSELLPEHLNELPEIENQRSGNTCVSNALLSVCEQRAKVNGVEINLSRKFHYGASLTVAGTVSDNGGMSMRTGLSCLKHFGSCLEEGPKSLFYNPPFNVTPALMFYEEALDNRIGEYQFPVKVGSRASTSEKIHMIKSALQEGFLVIVAFSINQLFLELTGPWYDQRYLKSNRVWRKNVYEHCTYLSGFKNKMFQGVNSWGDTWGDGGKYGVPDWIVDENYFEAAIIRDFKGWKTPEKPGIKIEKKDRYALHVRIVPEPRFMNTRVNIWVIAVWDEKIICLTPNGAINTEKTASEIIAQPDLLLPYKKNFLIDESEYVEIFDRVDLKPFAGAQLHIIYGTKLDDSVRQDVRI